MTDAVLPSKAWNRSKHQQSTRQKKRHTKRKNNASPSVSNERVNTVEEVEGEQEEGTTKQEHEESPEEEETEETVDRPYTLQELIDASRESFDESTKGRLRGDKEWDAQLAVSENGVMTSFDGEFLAVQLAELPLAKRLIFSDSNTTTSPLLVECLSQLEGVQNKGRVESISLTAGDNKPAAMTANRAIAVSGKQEEDELLDELLAL
eukprot:TRINITY_DN1513_c0_g1_i1.p1 TRINITY_DN1513_c0_g1~~TRINITY_DN1513_c0_g1_i1.p1  ORF type:complete len:207 (+),score=35.78 TRINITY_DN1513_c0_g1_i1:80-700(+)